MRWRVDAGRGDIFSFQRQQARETFADELLELEFEEREKARRIDAEREEEERQQLLTVSHVEILVWRPF